MDGLGIARLDKNDRQYIIKSTSIKLILKLLLWKIIHPVVVATAHKSMQIINCFTDFFVGNILLKNVIEMHQNTTSID